MDSKKSLHDQSLSVEGPQVEGGDIGPASHKADEVLNALASGADGDVDNPVGLPSELYADIWRRSAVQYLKVRLVDFSACVTDKVFRVVRLSVGFMRYTIQV